MNCHSHTESCYARPSVRTNNLRLGSTASAPRTQRFSKSDSADEVDSHRDSTALLLFSAPVAGSATAAPVSPAASRSISAAAIFFYFEKKIEREMLCSFQAQSQSTIEHE